MSERIRWHNLYVVAWCGTTPGCEYGERIEDPGPDEQKALIRRARQHARSTGHYVSVERGQVSGVEA